MASIRITNDLYKNVKTSAKSESYSVSEQIEFLARVEKTALDNPDLPINFIKELLISKELDKTQAEPYIFDD
ncbi:MAG: hypothetical protein GQ569_05450 [Methylococcaceae bacterium]|nr:hypothetical protein [Methylococcaceae bacterium]